MSKKTDAMALADAYAHASFYQGLHQLTVYEEPEIARAKLDAELRRLHSLNAEMLDALRNAEQLVQIAEEQARCMRQRIRLGWSEAGDDGRFGIAVKTDAAALRWQELDKQRNALIEVNRAAIAKAEAQQ